MKSSINEVSPQTHNKFLVFEIKAIFKKMTPARSRLTKPLSATLNRSKRIENSASG